VPVKEFENQSIIGENMDKSKVPCFLWTTVYISTINNTSITSALHLVCKRALSVQTHIMSWTGK